MYEKKVLPNGVRVLSERIDHVRSCSVGIWVGNGSRYEPAAVGGISHFIEHMIFKGTEQRTAQHIAIAMDAIGGQFNAFTTKECTCYYLKTLDTHLITGMDILADMFLHSKFDNKDIELERGVVYEEIDMYEDTPEDVATEKLFESCFEGSALGRPILGSRDTLARMDSDALHRYFNEYYRPHDTVIALSGSFSDEALDYICELFSAMPGQGTNKIEPAHYHTAVLARPKDIEQCHLCIAFPGLPLNHEERYAMQMLSAILGDGMSSRLFQTVREQNGLCYSVYSYVASHLDTGMFSVYTALGKPMERRAIELIGEVLRNFCAEGPTREELSRCREQRKTSMLMGLESTSARMNHLGRNELYLGYVPQPEELVAGYDAVTEAQVLNLARRILDFSNASICAVGQVEGEEYYADLLRRAGGLA
ncbi:MAG: M16 family metallopeptidase [Intestinibacillus sp.]